MSNELSPQGINLLLTPDKPALVDGQPTTLRVLARIQSPSEGEGAGPRPPLHVAIVLDRSGSMAGTPLDEAKRCARTMIDSLAPDDQAAIYAFDDEITCIAPLQPATGKMGLAAALASIDSGGMTNLHGGWQAGAGDLADHVTAGAISRVILLSDGAANKGETDLEAIATQCKAFARKGVGTSTYGLGDHFNEALMIAMASAGLGSAYYGQTAADLAEPFATEFALLTHLSARGLVLKVHAPEGVVVKLRNDYQPVEGEPNAWRLPDLAFASEAWALFEVTVPADQSGEAAVDPKHLPIVVSVQAASIDSTPLFVMASVPPLAVLDRAEWERLLPDRLVAQRALELDAADALLEVRRCIEAGDWEKATALVAAAKAKFASHEWASVIMATMERLVTQRDSRKGSKEAMFSARRMNYRLAALDELDQKLDVEESKAAWLRRKGEQGKGDPLSN